MAKNSPPGDGPRNGEMNIAECQNTLMTSPSFPVQASTMHIPACAGFATTDQHEGYFAGVNVAVRSLRVRCVTYRTSSSVNSRSCFGGLLVLIM